VNAVKSIRQSFNGRRLGAIAYDLKSLKYIGDEKLTWFFSALAGQK
jgi:hypothetical protein